MGSPLELPEGAEVSGAVDPVRRLEFRQQHTGKHIVSACLAETAGARTVSSSLGERFTTVEVDTPELGDRQLEAAEQRANQVTSAQL